MRCSASPREAGRRASGRAANRRRTLGPGCARNPLPNASPGRAFDRRCEVGPLLCSCPKPNGVNYKLEAAGPKRFTVHCASRTTYYEPRTGFRLPAFPSGAAAGWRRDAGGRNVKCRLGWPRVRSPTFGLGTAPTSTRLFPQGKENRGPPLSSVPASDPAGLPWGEGVAKPPEGGCWLKYGTQVVGGGMWAGWVLATGVQASASPTSPPPTPPQRRGLHRRGERTAGSGCGIRDTIPGRVPLPPERRPVLRALRGSGSEEPRGSPVRNDEESSTALQHPRRTVLPLRHPGQAPAGRATRGPMPEGQPGFRCRRKRWRAGEGSQNRCHRSQHEWPRRPAPCEDRCRT